MKKVFVVIIILSILPVSFAFDLTLLTALLEREIKKSPINEEVIIGQIKFIGFQPIGCIPENLKIREIKRPNSLEFTFKCDKRLYRALANYEILTKVYLTQRVIKKGDTIKEEDLIEIKQPANRTPLGAITDKRLIVGKIAKRSLAQGVIIKQEHLYPNTPVKRGSKVNLVIEIGKVIIMTEGVLKSDSVVGDTALVHCIQTGKDIVGKLVDKNTVRVIL
ncbi:MAG: flagellar basal body P-ring formation chaperone FlgA [Thermodesulfovibrio sp.]|nr:flagellar basal body P-ring formation chaperone FlgA [Thermodesulfovibrio sp.]